MNASEMTDTEHARGRSGMYIGSTGFFGLVHYLVAAVDLQLEGHPTFLTVEVADGVFTFESDSELHVEQMPDGMVWPFEVVRRGENDTKYEESWSMPSRSE